MISNNIITIIIVLIMIGVIVYFYYNCKNSAIGNNAMVSKNDISVTTNNKSTKKVRFNNNIKYNTYKKNPILSDTIDVLSPKANINIDNIYSPISKIDVDSIFTSIGKNSSYDSINVNRLNKSNNLLSPTNESVRSINNSESNNSENLYSTIPYSKNNNLWTHDFKNNEPEELWDANFGLPLMDKNEKQKYIKEMHKNHKEYQKSLGKFTQYQTDDNTLIQTDTTINPFKPTKCNQSLKGLTVREIYDKQVAGPITKSKKIKSRSDNKITYENEIEMNGGKIKGTNMCAFDNSNEFR